MTRGDAFEIAHKPGATYERLAGHIQISLAMLRCTSAVTRYRHQSVRARARAVKGLPAIQPATTNQFLLSDYRARMRTRENTAPCTVSVLCIHHFVLTISIHVQELSVITHNIIFILTSVSMSVICLLDINFNVKFGLGAGSSGLMDVHLEQVRTCDCRNYLTW